MLPGWASAAIMATLPSLTKSQPLPPPPVLNTCTSQALVELLRFLKRCYWPYPWAAAGGAHGGFAGAATVFLEGESDAAMQARKKGLVGGASAARTRRGLPGCLPSQPLPSGAQF